ncbi:uncharacterized protein YgbK (DUF1537 family) [Rhodoligotrophos appendicifer]|uniref:3-oxo-tetronate kinase n=1 Tax=Rhodoligotrophos appendicifer TaxID=987056 RepID=UPI0011864634|nr:3-oxo-tetronate kinase [Rhodoligotrophos appendicifer]
MLLGCIADDFTGASDLANTLAKGGMATTQFVGIPSDEAAIGCEAGVVALKTRSIAPSAAVEQSLAALHWLQRQGCTQILFKYCSTFDSTPEGNIGPVAEALADALGAEIAVVCPVFPETGRTLYQGHLFIGDRLLDQSGMEHHPLNPMTDPDIRRWLRRQTRGEIGLVPYEIVRRGSAAIDAALAQESASGRRLVVVDAITPADLRAIGAAIAGHRLVTGGSGIAVGIPDNFRKEARLGAGRRSFSGLAGPGIALSGSCSPASRAQLARHLEDHPGLAVEPTTLMGATLTVADALHFVRSHQAAAPIVYSTADPQTVAEAQARYGREALAARIEEFFGTLAVELVANGVERLAIGGGETSGAVVTALGLRSLEIGPEIDPGIPALAAKAGARDIRLALKSGNFGAPDFYAKALRALAAP